MISTGASTVWIVTDCGRVVLPPSGSLSACSIGASVFGDFLNENYLELINKKPLPKVKKLLESKATFGKFLLVGTPISKSFSANHFHKKCQITIYVLSCAAVKNKIK